MPSPVISFTDVTSATISSLSFGNVPAGTTSSVFTVMIFNNKNGGTTVSDATQCQITTKTWTGLDSGDTVPNGQEVVSYETLQVKCTSQGDSGYTPVGGEITHAVGSAAGGTGTIKGFIGGDAAIVLMTQNPPLNITAGTAQYLIRILYVYS